MKKNKIAVIWGEATIDAPGKISVKASKASRPRARSAPGSYQAKHIIVATGARPRVLPGLEPDKKLIWTYFEAMVPPAMPKSLLVVGSGAIGIEFASFLPHALGSRSRWSRCCRKSCPWRMPRSPRSRASASSGRASRSSPAPR